MELIKQIKETESKARQVVDQAKADAVKMAEQNRKKRNEAMAVAEQQRRAAIDAAVKSAEADGIKEIETMKADAEKKRADLGASASVKLEAAAAKVMDYLRG